MTIKNLRAWQPISVFAAALGTYPARIHLIQSEYDLFDTRDATEADRPKKNCTNLKYMWRLKEGATSADVAAADAAMLEAGGARALAGAKKRGKRKPDAKKKPAAPPAPQHRHTPETVEAPKPALHVAPPVFVGNAPGKPRVVAAVKARTTHTVEPLPFEVSSPEELAQALLALARAVYPDTKTLALHLAGVTYDAGRK